MQINKIRIKRHIKRHIIRHIKNSGYTAFFDLDKTLINGNSGTYLIQLAYRKKLIAFPDLAKPIWSSLLYKFSIRETENILSDMLNRLAGVPEKVLRDLSSELFEDYLLKEFVSEAKPELSFHKEQGARTVILSSSLSPICSLAAKHFQMDEILCTDPEIINGYLTGRTNRPFCYGIEKLVRLKEYCELNNTTPGDSWYYGDSISDLPVLNAVGHPVCINPDKKLKPIAEKNGWTVKYWH